MFLKLKAAALWAANPQGISDATPPQKSTERPTKQLTATPSSTKKAGDDAENTALQHLQHAGLRLLQRNYRTPGRGGGEIDLIMRAPDGTTVFVEVRKRSTASHGGAAASVSVTKQRRIVFAARHYLMHLATPPPCRFDVVTVEYGDVQWLKAAFDAS